MIRPVLLVVVLAVGASGGFLLGKHMSAPKKPLVHKLKEPLVLAGGEGEAVRTYLLPSGTSLYYDQAFPEGFVRYKVYINVEGVDWEPKPADEKFWIDPLSALPVGRDQLAELIKNHPLTKEELRSILGATVFPEMRSRQSSRSSQIKGHARRAIPMRVCLSHALHLGARCSPRSRAPRCWSISSTATSTTRSSSASGTTARTSCPGPRAVTPAPITPAPSLAGITRTWMGREPTNGWSTTPPQQQPLLVQAGTSSIQAIPLSLTKKWRTGPRSTTRRS